MATQTRDNGLTLGEVFGLYLSGAVCATAVATTGLTLRVVEETEKAVRVQAVAEDGALRHTYCWLPRAGLKLRWDEGRYGRCFELAGWFQRKLDGYTSNFLTRNSHSSGVATRAA